MNFESDILNQMSFGIVKFRNDFYSTILYGNQQFYQFIGYTEKQFKEELQNQLSKLMYEDTRNSVFTTPFFIGKEGKIETELHIRRRDNTDIWLCGQIYSEDDHNFYGSFMNITIQKKEFLIMEYELMRYRALEETAQDILFHYDILSDTMTYSYKTKTKYFRKFTMDSFLRSKKYEVYVHPDSWEQYSSALLTASHTPSSGSFEYCSKIIENTFTWYQLTYCSQWSAGTGNRSVIGRLTNIHQLVLDRITMNEKISMDAMTGLYHKVAAQEKMVHYIESVNQDISALLVIDLDNFKTINDTFGHAMGDHVLRHVAKLLQRVFSNNDIIGRFGGDEFIVLMKNATPTTVKRKIHQYQKLLTEGDFDIPFPISGSIGVAFSNHCKNNYPLLFQHADAAMYNAKRMGKNRYYFHVNKEAE